MPRKSPVGAAAVSKASEPYLRKGPIIPGRPLITGERLTFPAFYRVEEKPVTFRSGGGVRSREEREEYVIDWIARVRKDRKLIVLLVPYHNYVNTEAVFFHTGWTLFEREGEIRTHQCIVFLSGEAVPLGRSDQGVICVALKRSLSAWDGRTEEESRARAA